MSSAYFCERLSEYQLPESTQPNQPKSVTAQLTPSAVPIACRKAASEYRGAGKRPRRTA